MNRSDEFHAAARAIVEYIRHGRDDPSQLAELLTTLIDESREPVVKVPSRRPTFDGTNQCDKVDVYQARCWGDLGHDNPCMF